MVPCDPNLVNEDQRLLEEVMKYCGCIPSYWSSFTDLDLQKCEPDANIEFTSWNIGDHEGEIIIGKYSLITPGVRIMAAEKIYYAVRDSSKVPITNDVEITVFAEAEVNTIDGGTYGTA